MSGHRFSPPPAGSEPDLIVSTNSLRSPRLVPDSALRASQPVGLPMEQRLFRCLPACEHRRVRIELARAVEAPQRSIGISARRLEAEAHQPRPPVGRFLTRGGSRRHQSGLGFTRGLEDEGLLKQRGSPHPARRPQRPGRRLSAWREITRLRSLLAFPDQRSRCDRNRDQHDREKGRCGDRDPRGPARSPTGPRADRVS